MQTRGLNRLLAVTCSVALLLMIGWLLKAGQSILLPVLVAIIVVYILTTAADSMARLPVLGRLQRRWRRLIVLAGMVTGVLILAAFVTSNATAISAAIPRYAQNFDVLQTQFLHILGVDELPNWARLSEGLLDLVDITTLMPTVLSTITNAGSIVVAAALYAAFIIAELDGFPAKTRRALDQSEQAERTLEVVHQINEKIGGYLAAKTLVNVVLGLVSLGVLWLLGIDFPVFWAIVIALLNYIPYIGSVIAVAFPVTTGLVQYASFGHAALTLVALMVPQMVVAYYIEPKFLGHSVNLSPFTVLLSLAIWSGLWGMMGALLAIPLTAMVMIILAELPSARFIAVLMSQTGDP
ncbi:AI-2E family transporter [Antarcticimicrobium sediminis]|uniref:AI-2E family transporter n=1 Tax=Antarcticimicrobium sediminis TaxID=2546227 RepID=A0A4R5ER15_9RHOB|nr:AI-2E family transporter [Antarcticimicrobium sediminis]TDE37127.1 AI-2E family transporter [Antarcticimicrobium sediminis]